MHLRRSDFSENQSRNSIIECEGQVTDLEKLLKVFTSEKSTNLST